MCDCNKCGNFKDKCEIIEVGDIVRASICEELVVLGVCSINEEAAVQWPDNTVGMRDLSCLTLIRKGGKKYVFGVRVHKEVDGLKVIGDFERLVGNGKEYRMTLEETI